MNIDPEKFTELGISAIKEMAEVAKRNGQQEVEVWHLLSALMAQENGIVPALWKRWEWVRSGSTWVYRENSKIYLRLQEMLIHLVPMLPLH